MKFVRRFVVVALLLASQRLAAVAQVPMMVAMGPGLEADHAEQLPPAASGVTNDSTGVSQPSPEGTNNQPISNNAIIVNDDGDEASLSGQAAYGCEPICGCGDSCSQYADCSLGSAWTLHNAVAPCCNDNFGGWIAAGYYSNQTGLSFFAPLNDFNDYPDHLNLDQAWLYAEKVAQGGCCAADWGYRADVVYGVQAQKTQAFGNNDGSWDNSFDNGVYGWAIPQAYGEIAYGDWSLKVGHFFNFEDYEVIPATGNFFYSHSLTFNNSGPFTYTGALNTFKVSDATTVWAGWALGWDTGFDQFNGGSNWVGGVKTQASDDLTIAYVSSAGNFGLRSAGGSAYSQSVYAIADLTCRTQYVFETEYSTSNGFLSYPGFDAHNYGIVNYLFYTLSDCWKAGGRVEWLKTNTITGEGTSYYELTGGVNYHANANMVVRPEIRYDWSPTNFAGDYNRVVFGIDAVVTF